MTIRIQQRLTLIFSLIFAIVFIGIYFYLEAKLTQDAYRSIRESLRQKLSLSRIYIEESSASKSLLPEQWDAIADRTGAALGLRTTVIARDGKVLGDSGLALDQVKTVENHLHRPEVQKALTRGFGEERRYSMTLNQDMLYMAMPVSEQKEAIVRLAIPLTELRIVSTHLRVLLVFSFVLTFVIAVLLSFIASGYFSRPLKEMAEIAKKIAQGDLSQKISLRSGDELSDYARSMNYMSDQIRMRMEEVAKEKSQLEAVLLSMIEGVLVIDKQGRIVLMNESFRQFFHIKEETSGKNTLEVIRNLKVKEMVDKVLKSPAGVESTEISVSVPEEKGMLVHAAPILRAGQLEGVVVVFHDITQLRHMERLRREFVANVSHELRTPLASIKGYAETLLDGALEDKDNARDFLNIIHADAERLARLINDTLDLSKIESGSLEFQFRPVDAGDVVVRVLKGLQRQIEEKKLLIRNDITANAPKVQADEDRLMQVVFNLVDNAVKYTPQGGRITITARPKDGFLEISVADSGVGIPAQDLPRVFERFYRVDKARSRDLGGTGLGLAIVKHIVQAHDGDVVVESRPGQGSTFTFTLPIA